MKTQTLFIKAFCVIFCVSAIALAANAQTGLFYYANPSQKYVNNKLLSLTQAPNQEIYLLGKLSTANYEESVPYFARIDKRGHLLLDKILEKKHIYDMADIFISTEQQVVVFGSSRQGPIFAPWWSTLKASGDIAREKNDYVVYSTILNDVAHLDQDEYVLAETRMDNNNTYNIHLVKVNSLTDEVVWSKKVESTQNEEASKIIKLRDGNMLIIGKKYNATLSDFSAVLYKINSSGKSLWRVSVPVPDNFYAQSVAEASNGKLIYMCSYSKESMGTNETRVLQLNADGGKERYNVILDMSSNGLVMRPDNNFILYGSCIMVQSERAVTKGKYVVVDDKLQQVYEYTLSETDKPDSQMPEDVRKNLPTNSDLVSGLLLHDGRLALVGRIHMPVKPQNASNYGADRNNLGMLLLLNSNGRF